MPISIGTLPVVPLDYTSRGPGLHPGMAKLESLLGDAEGREGFLQIQVKVPGAVITAVMARSDLYILGFRSGGSWYRFDDAAWPFSGAVTKLGYEGRYACLGGLTGDLSLGGIAAIAALANPAQRPSWKPSLRSLLVAVSECARLIPVRMQVLGLLNGVVGSVPLAPLAHYIQNWDRASKGQDMSREVAPNIRQGFTDPTILKR